MSQTIRKNADGSTEVLREGTRMPKRPGPVPKDHPDHPASRSAKRMAKTGAQNTAPAKGDDAGKATTKDKE